MTSVPLFVASCCLFGSNNGDRTYILYMSPGVCGSTSGIQINILFYLSIQHLHAKVHKKCTNNHSHTYFLVGKNTILQQLLFLLLLHIVWLTGIDKTSMVTSYATGVNPPVIHHTVILHLNAVYKKCTINSHISSSCCCCCCC